MPFRNQTIAVTPELIDVVFLAVDDLEEMVQSIASGGDGKRDVSNAVEKLKLIEECSKFFCHRRTKGSSCSYC